MRRAKTSPVEHDVVGQAGWMYTDLMLALMVVFLATISFVPNFSSVSAESPDANSGEYSYSKVFDESLNILYEGFNPNQIEVDVNQFKRSRGLPMESDIVFAQYVGGYASGSESPSKAIARALEFSKKLDQANPLLLGNAATTLSSSNVLKPNQVIVRFTFATPSKIKK
jgi:hypothetical protein